VNGAVRIAREGDGQKSASVVIAAGRVPSTRQSRRVVALSNASRVPAMWRVASWLASAAIALGLAVQDEKMSRLVMRRAAAAV
jgi:hypothetical protein